MRAFYIKNTVTGKIFDFINTILMLVLIFIMLYPFWNQLILSVNEGTDSARGGIYFWPRVFTLESYQYIFAKSNIGKGALMSVLRVIIGTSTCLFCTGLLAYITTVKWFSGRKFTRVVFVITMYFSGGMIPTFLLMNKLGLINSFHVYWIPGLFSAYFMMLFASYMYDLPEALAESARIDGCNELRIYLRIIAPMCVPVFAAIAVFSSVGHWNSWFDVFLYNYNGKYDTLQVYLRRILLDAEQTSKLLNDQQKMAAYRKMTPNSVRAATTMIVTVPIVFVYPFLQKYFIGGITIGAVKG